MEKPNEAITKTIPDTLAKIESEVKSLRGLTSPVAIVDELTQPTEVLLFEEGTVKFYRVDYLKRPEDSFYQPLDEGDLYYFEDTQLPAGQRRYLGFQRDANLPVRNIDAYVRELMMTPAEPIEYRLPKAARERVMELLHEAAHRFAQRIWVHHGQSEPESAAPGR